MFSLWFTYSLEVTEIEQRSHSHAVFDLVWSGWQTESQAIKNQSKKWEAQNNPAEESVLLK